MIKVSCKTNLDLSNEKWPELMSGVPSVGHTVVSSTVHRNGFQLELQVTAVSWVKSEYESDGGWIPYIELHMTDLQRRLPASKPGAATGSIVAFYEWYAPNVGRSVAAFI